MDLIVSTHAPQLITTKAFRRKKVIGFIRTPLPGDFFKYFNRMYVASKWVFMGFWMNWLRRE